MHSVNELDLAHLHARFVVPVAVHDILQGIESFDDIAEYSLHEVLSELQPDTALLCLAMCGQHIAAQTGFLPFSKVLMVEANNIIEDYAPLWLAYDAGKELDDETVFQALQYIPEDLESLTDLFQIIGNQVKDSLPVASLLCDVLALQADAHKDFAESMLDDPDSHTQKLEDSYLEHPPVLPEKNENNIIPFPVSDETLQNVTK